MKKSNVIYQLSEQSLSQMMSYIIQTKDDKFIIIDGGTENDTAYLLEFLSKLEGYNNIINGWILTHAHHDHINAFMDVISNHKGKINIKNIYYNFPEAAFIQQYEPQYAHTIQEFNALLPAFQDKCTIITDGDKIKFDEIIFDIMSSPDDMITQNAINNSSIVLKMHVDGQSVLFLGDLGIEAGDKILLKYGKKGLKSDIVQMAHHGQNGVGKNVYEAINAKVCLWNTPKWLWNNDAGAGVNTGPWKTVAVRTWMNELKVSHHFITKDGTCKISFPMNLWNKDNDF